VLILVFLPVVIVAMAFVLNWIYLVLVHHNMQQRSDIFSLVGVTELRDEHLLSELAPDQSDDVIAAEAAVAAFMSLNNNVGPAALELNATDITVTPGYVADLSAPVGPGNFDPNPPYNTLRIDIERSNSTANPVALLLRGFGSPDDADVFCASYATLDARLVGFRPRLDMPAPVVPLAIRAESWTTDRVNDNVDLFPPGGNGRKELALRVRSSDPAGPPPTAALAALDGVSVVIADVRRQIVDGIVPTDVPGGELGPATGGTPLVLPATQTVASQTVTDQLVGDFQDVLISSDPRRIFPLYDSYDSAAGTVDVVGFVAAVVLESENAAAAPDYQLQVTIEPIFIVHSTAWTDPAAPDENLYIHKVRITR